MLLGFVLKSFFLPITHKLISGILPSNKSNSIVVFTLLSFMSLSFTFKVLNILYSKSPKELFFSSIS